MRRLSLEELIIFPPVSHWLCSSPHASAYNYLCTWSSLSLELKVPGGGIWMFLFILFSWHLARCLVSEFICLGEERWMWHNKICKGVMGFSEGQNIMLGLFLRALSGFKKMLLHIWVTQSPVMELDLGLESPFAVPFPLKLSVGFIPLTLSRHSIFLCS